MTNSQLELKELADKLEATKVKINIINEVNQNIQSNNVEIAKENSSICQLEKFNAGLQTEVDHLENAQVENTDHADLKELREEISTLTDLKSKLREDKTYAEASKNMLQDTGTKTKIIKQYLPIMNKLINTYLSSMEFYVNFTLNENLKRISSQDIVTTSHMNLLVKVRKCVLTLLCCLHGERKQR